MAKFLDTETIKKILSKLELDYGISVASSEPISKEKIIEALKDIFGSGADVMVQEYVDTYYFLKAKK